MSDPTTPKKSHGRLSIRATATPRDLMDEPRLVKGAWPAKIITLFPDAFPGALGLSLTGKALDLGLWPLDAIDLRPFGDGKHRNVDDTPAGGGAGMVLRPDVVDAALRTPRRNARRPGPLAGDLPFPARRAFDQAIARRLAAGDGLTLLCGRFEGVDQRVLDHHQVEEFAGRFRPDRGRDRRPGGAGRDGAPVARRPWQCRLDRRGKLFRRAAGAPAVHPAGTLERREQRPSCSRATTQRSRSGAAPRPKR